MAKGPKMDVSPEERARLRKLREALGWRQEDLAAKIGVSVPAISNLETGRDDQQSYKAVYAEVIRALKAGNDPDPGADRFRKVVEKLLRLDARGWASVEATIDAQLEYQDSDEQ